MLDLLAQLVAPPLQNSPVRVPGPDAVEQRPRSDQEPTLQLGPNEQAPTRLERQPSQPQPLVDTTSTVTLPDIKGTLRYNNAQLRRILAQCLQVSEPNQRLNDCAKALTARLVADGYVNSGAIVRGSGASAYLEIVEGRLVEVRITSSDARLQRRVTRLLQPLQGRVLNLNTLQQDLMLLKRTPGVGTIQASLDSLGEDPSQAVFTITVTPGSRPWRGELTFRNDGSPGSGEYRANAALVGGDLALSGDTLLLYGETSWTGDPNVGQVISSISYTLPLAETFSFTGSFGYTLNESPELDTDIVDIGSDQYQGLGQFDYVFSESLRHRWSSFAGVSVNSNTLTLGIPDFPDLSLTQNNTYLRLGVNGSGLSGPLTWSSSAYLLQGLATDFVDAGSATALGGLAQAGWTFAPDWQLNGRLGGQVAFGDLPTAMYFSLGSDVGLRGLPGQLISGEDGWLGTTELVWTFWQDRANALQLVPFIGAGGVNTNLDAFSFNDTVGSGGLLARWIGGQNWAVELGWVHQFETENNLGVWNDWLLDDGLYGKVSFRF